MSRTVKKTRGAHGHATVHPKVHHDSKKHVNPNERNAKMHKKSHHKG